MHLARGTLYNILRPQKFGEVIGQDNTVKSIQMALSKGVLEHALIFYGQTGGGKTTLARIVAKYLQCNDIKDNEPCCMCDSCTSIKQDNFSDYVELNAATNGGKEDIDKLLENVNFSPSFGKARVYVIDEAQRLSQSAWASLLKVLEEPPEHAYFILCTTEPGAIPETIKNRCGKYEFSRIKKIDILGALKKIRESEGVKFTDEALELISEGADGSMRNAINSFSHISMPFDKEKMIDADAVKKYLSLVGSETMADFIKSICERDLRSAVEILERQQQQAVGADTFIKSILSVISDCITVMCGARLGREVSAGYDTCIKEISRCGANRLSEISGELNAIYQRVSDRTYACIKIAVMKLCVMNKCSDDSLIDSLLERIDLLEKRLNTDNNYEVLKARDCQDTINRDEFSDQYNNADVNYEDTYSQVDDTEVPEQLESIAYEEDLYGDVVSDECENMDICNEDDDFEFLSLFDDTYTDYDDNPFVEEMCAVSTQNDDEESQSDSDTYHTSIGIYEEGITFSSREIAKQFEQSQDIVPKTLKALKYASEEEPLFKALLDCCQAEKTKNGVALATPFAPVATVIKQMLILLKITGVDVIAVDAIQI